MELGPAQNIQLAVHCLDTHTQVYRYIYIYIHIHTYMYIEDSIVHVPPDLASSDSYSADEFARTACDEVTGIVSCSRRSCEFSVHAQSYLLVPLP